MRRRDYDPRPVEIRRAEIVDHPALTAVLARAFDDDAIEISPSTAGMDSR
jgi:hypothetical protein